MSDLHRIKGRIVPIDYAATHSFFEARGRRDYDNPLSATMYQDNEPELVAKRDAVEKINFCKSVGLEGISSVLDIGCGIGRWGWFLSENYDLIKYLGIDFSASLIEKAKRESKSRSLSGFEFQVMSASDIREADLLVSPPFDLLLISGLLMYLNDEDCLRLFKKVAGLCVPGGVIYVREPVGVSERFTLNRYFSKELSDEYSAIYRTVDEIKALMNKSFGDFRMEIELEGFLFPEDLEKRAETRQYFFVIRREGAAV